MSVILRLGLVLFALTAALTAQRLVVTADTTDIA